MLNRTKFCVAGFCAVLAASTSLSAPAYAETTLPARLQAIDHGPTAAGKIITIDVHLLLPDEAGFLKTVNDLYDRTSPRFHKWLTDADLQKFAPPAQQRDAVRAQLQAAGLTVLGTDKNGFSIRARGRVSEVARAFNTDIHDFVRNGEVFRRNITPARLTGDAGAYVKTVAGIESHIVHPMLTRARNFQTGGALANTPLKDVRLKGLGSLVTDQILSSPQSFTYTTSGASLPTATYSGVVYGANPNLLPDYTPKDLQTAYALQPVYNKGWNGSGQTVVVVEGYGYPTVEADANAAASLEGLPPFTPSNFSIVYPEGQPFDPNEGIISGWNVEIALDVQSAHSIAPHANILVVATSGQDSEDFQASMQYIIDNNLGSAISDSWEEDQDISSGPAEESSFEDILIVAAAKGISFQFSTGDGGDGGLGTPLGAPGVPADSPHATAVGGTAIVNNLGGTGVTHLAWGDGISEIASGGPVIPPYAFFYAGGGGGESVYWPKPSWQASLPGTGRQTPDVSALGDPFTGFPIVLTNPANGKKEVEPGWGGTSLSSPIFTAMWAIAQQAAGGPLGQASPLLAGLNTGLIDVLPYGSTNNITGSSTTSSGTKKYTTADIFAGIIEQNTTFLGTITNVDGGAVGYGFGFGLDSSLTVTPGWDNATGYGTPSGLAFFKAVVAASAAP